MRGHLKIPGFGQSEALAGEEREAWSGSSALAWLLRPSVRHIAYRAALAVLIAVGIYFRSRRYWIDPLGLWLDEAQWGLRLFERPLTQLEFRPIGYMALTKLIVSMYSDERTLRLLSYAGSILSLLITADLAAHWLKSRCVRVLCMAVVAYNPLLIDMAREFKPYALKFCVHLGLVWLFVRWRASGSRGWLCALLICSAFAFPFAYNVAFLLPGLFTLVVYRLLREKRYRQLSLTVGAAFAALALMIGIYFAALHSTTHDTDSSAQFWGKKYDAFFLPHAHERHPAWAHAVWLAEKYRDLAELPGSHGNRPLAGKALLTEATRALSVLGEKAWLGLHALSLLALLRYRREQLLLLIGPLLLSMGFNLLCLWPFGAFRGNVFLLTYLISIPMLGLDVLWSARSVLSRSVAALGSAFLFVVSASAGFEPHIRKHFFSSQSEMTSLVERMAELRAQLPAALQQQPTLVVLDSYTCTPFIFEARHNDTANRRFGPFLGKNVNVQCTGSVAASAKLLARDSGQPFFEVVSDDRQMAGYEKMLSSKAHLTDHEQIRGTHDLYFGTAR